MKSKFDLLTKTAVNAVIFLLAALVAQPFVLAYQPASPFEGSWQELIQEGNTDINMQKLVEAEWCFRRALKKVKHASNDERDEIKCLEKLASTLALENQIEEAIKIYHKALHMRERIYGKESPQLVPTLFALGSIFESEGNPKLAMELYQRALAINEKNYGPQSPSVADSLHRLGHADVGAGMPEQAEKNYKSSLSILMQQPSLSSSRQLESLLSDYSDLLRKADNSDQTLVSSFQNEILKDRMRSPSAAVPPSAWHKEITEQAKKRNDWQNEEEEKVLLRGVTEPANGESTLKPVYDTMANSLYAYQRYNLGEDNYKRMIAVDIKSLGPDHPSVANDLVGLALLYITQHRYDEAKPLLEKALSVYQNAYGNDNSLVARTRAYLASVYIKLGNKEQAFALYNQAFGKGHLIVDPNSLETARMLNELAYLYYSQGKLEDARTLYEWALASTKAAVGEQNVLVAACLTDYSNLLRNLGRTFEANEMADKARMIQFIDSGVKDIEEQKND